MREDRQDLVREILRDLPVSIRALGRAAGLSHVSLIRARDGRTRLSEDSAHRIVHALRELGERCTELADRLEALIDESDR